MFNVGIFGRDQSTQSEELEFERANLRCSSISIGSPELQFGDRHPLTKQHLIEGMSLIDTISITWLEDQLLNVWNYHRTWMSYFYDRERDQFRSGARGKRRVAEVFLQEMLDKQSTDTPNAREGQAGATQHFLILDGLIPTKLPDFSLGWSNDDSSSMEIELTYRVDSIRYQITDQRALSAGEESQFRSRPGGQYPTSFEGVEI